MTSRAKRSRKRSRKRSKRRSSRRYSGNEQHLLDLISTFKRYKSNSKRLKMEGDQYLRDGDLNKARIDTIEISIYPTGEQYKFFAKCTLHPGNIQINFTISAKNIDDAVSKFVKRTYSFFANNQELEKGNEILLTGTGTVQGREYEVAFDENKMTISPAPLLRDHRQGKV